MSEDQVKKNLEIEICKQLRRETGISIGVCNEASKESQGDIEKARIILKEKCIKIGEKYYKNKEKPLLYFAIAYEENINTIKLIKIGCQSDFLIAGDTIEQMTANILKIDNFGNFTNKELSIMENEVKFNCGLVRENIQSLVNISYEKKDEEFFYIMKNNTPNNNNLYSNISIIKYKGNIPELNDETIKQISINIHGYMKKHIVNNAVENNKPIQYIYELKGSELEEFYHNPLMTDRTKTLKEFLENNQVHIEILSIFCI